MQVLLGCFRKVMTGKYCIDTHKTHKHIPQHMDSFNFIKYNSSLIGSNKQINEGRAFKGVMTSASFVLTFIILAAQS